MTTTARSQRVSWCHKSALPKRRSWLFKRVHEGLESIFLLVSLGWRQFYLCFAFSIFDELYPSVFDLPFVCSVTAHLSAFKRKIHTQSLLSNISIDQETIDHLLLPLKRNKSVRPSTHFLCVYTRSPSARSLPTAIFPLFSPTPFPSPRRTSFLPRYSPAAFSSPSLCLLSSRVSPSKSEGLI